MLGLVLVLALAADPVVDQSDALGVPTDPSIKNLQWNKRSSKHFTILSIDDGQGQYLEANIDKIKSWVLERWGLPDVDFSKECRVLCVPKQEQFMKLLNLKESKIETRPDMNVIWLLLDDKPSRTVPIPLTEVCLKEMEQKTGTKLPFWAHRGMARLNGTLSDIRADLVYLAPILKSDQPMYWSDQLLTMSEADLVKEKPDNQILFDREAELFCLLLRKEYGQTKFLDFAKACSSENPQRALQEVLGFKSYNHFDATFKRYMTDLSNDLVKSVTPDTYLEIRPKGK